MSDMDILRSIAKKGLKLAHERDTAFVDIFQHMLDEITWYENRQRELVVMTGKSNVGKSIVAPALCHVCGEGITGVYFDEDGLLYRLCDTCGSETVGLAESKYNAELFRGKNVKNSVSVEEQKDGK